MGMRVKFTLCITAAGMCAPLFFVVHCNEREVRDPSGVVVVKVPCMCIGGDVDPFSNGHGFIAFVRGSTAEDEESAMIKLHTFQRNNWITPFVEKIRTKYHGWVPGTPVPMDLKAVVSADGAPEQLMSLVSRNTAGYRRGEYHRGHQASGRCNRHPAAMRPREVV